MIQINLLPWREQARQIKKVRFIGLFAICLFFTLFVWMVLHCIYSYQASTQKSLTDYLQSEINTEQNILSGITDQQHEKSDLETQLQFISNIYTNNYNMVRVLNELVVIVPSSLTISKITQDGNKISLEGIAQSDLDVTHFMQDVAQSSVFEQPVLSNLSGESNATSSGRYFKIDLQLKRTNT